MAHELRVLGPPELIRRDGVTVTLSLGKPLALLIYVACQQTPISRDELAGIFWPEANRARGRQSVRQALWVLKNAIGEDLFENHDPLRLKPGILETDLQGFNEALTHGRTEEAITLWRGPILEHFVLAGVRHWNHWKEDLRGELERKFLSALLLHAEFLRKEGEPKKALAVLAQATAVVPVSEAAHLARIELLLDLLRLDAAREALSDAHQTLGDNPDSAHRLSVLEERLNQIIHEQRASVDQGESFPLEFVGRSRELAGLQSLWKDAELGRTRLAVVTGPSGIGKTRVAQEFLSGVRGNGHQSISVKGTRAEMKLRWGAASDFVRQLLRLPGSPGISRGSDSLLRAMLPSLGQDAIDLQAVNGVSPAAILDAVSDLLEAITFESPLAILADDFQWMDRDSRTLFQGLVSRTGDLRILFLILGRSDLSSRHWEEVEETLVKEAGAQPFVLRPLIQEEVGELLALGAAFSQPEDATRVVKKIHRASGGNPLFVLEILKELVETGILRRGDQGWVFHTSELPREFRLPENIRTLLRERLDRLSNPALTLGATLAQEDRGMASEKLQKKTLLPEGAFTQAVAELLERGVIEWVDGTSLDFVHDILRDTAKLHLAQALPKATRPPHRFVRTKVALALVAALVVALPLAVLWGHRILSQESSQEPIPYGGGTILFQRSTGPFLLLEARGASPEAWQTLVFDLPPNSPVRSRFSGPGGQRLWFDADDHEDGPDMVQVLGDGTRIPLFPGRGDQTLYDVSPDGTRILFLSEDTLPTRFTHDLFEASLETLEKKLIYKGRGPLFQPQWSGNGDLVAFSIIAAEDTLAVYSLLGEPIGGVALGEIHGLSWCGESVLAHATVEEAVLLMVEVPEMRVDTISPFEAHGRVSCSPDGGAVVYTGVVENHIAPMLLDLRTGETHVLSVDPKVFAPDWQPLGTRVVPRAIQTSEDTVWVAWGDDLPLTATLVLSDGTRSKEGIWWESLNPGVASVSPSHGLTGNNAGVTPVLARWGYSLLDTLIVVVEDREGEGGALFRARFSDTLDTTRWRPLGGPPPLLRTVDGERILHLRGDEKYTDGVLLREPIPIELGVTVELEFRMDLTKEVHQNFGLCLRDARLADPSFEESLLEGSDTETCFRYPAREFEKRDPTQAVLYVRPGLEEKVTLPQAFPPDDWTHVALQVRADGQVTLIVDRIPVATNPIFLEMEPARDWGLILSGDSSDNRLFVRNLVIWPGLRY